MLRHIVSTNFYVFWNYNRSYLSVKIAIMDYPGLIDPIAQVERMSSVTGFIAGMTNW